MEELEGVKWFGHASFSFVDKATGNKIYYIDPFDLPNGGGLEKADLIFITHAHYDHLSQNDIAKLLKKDTVIVGPMDCLAQIELTSDQKQEVVPNLDYTVKGVDFHTVPAYNIKPERKSFHPKENNWVGYVLIINGKKIYHSGDTDFIPDMKEFKDLEIDIAMIPIGGTYTMSVDEAIEAANEIQAKITIPIHYKRLLGDKAGEAEEKFKLGVKNSKAVILEEA